MSNSVLTYFTIDKKFSKPKTTFLNYRTDNTKHRNYIGTNVENSITSLLNTMQLCRKRQYTSAKRIILLSL
jgi:hypothetical protein